MDTTDHGNTNGRPLKDFSTKASDDTDLEICTRVDPHWIMQKQGRVGTGPTMRTKLILRFSDKDDGRGVDMRDFVRKALLAHFSPQELQQMLFKMAEILFGTAGCHKYWIG